MYYGWGGMSRAPEDKALRANFLLHWTALSAAKREGLGRYDLAGESPFKHWFSPDTIEWPAPLWKIRGILGRAHTGALVAPESDAAWRRTWRRFMRRWSATERMPQ